MSQHPILEMDLRRVPAVRRGLSTRAPQAQLGRAHPLRTSTLRLPTRNLFSF
ncbi:MAG: hypothetical protein UY76_C0037G0006 [Candidatus Uhrbacteria bacterium GW2011_GWA2_52_8d]|uniref:Uncharacterized protein n=1 Tax=Candidatus Uhrbacteria bacterium GW2011_GWA2_52_8d TaxID=1618979 RepID=A0A0G1XLQ2_9BACT|nr:MAG: hypothetical protein UY76_C0037G0006 [Candidatus Uhrbacteria bacterium GW2011_GWA2_52_8d]